MFEPEFDTSNIHAWAGELWGIDRSKMFLYSEKLQVDRKVFAYEGGTR